MGLNHHFTTIFGIVTFDESVLALLSGMPLQIFLPYTQMTSQIGTPYELFQTIIVQMKWNEFSFKFGACATKQNKTLFKWHLSIESTQPHWSGQSISYLGQWSAKCVLTFFASIVILQYSQHLSSNKHEWSRWLSKSPKEPFHWQSLFVHNTRNSFTSRRIGKHCCQLTLKICSRHLGQRCLVGGWSKILPMHKWQKRCCCAHPIVLAILYTPKHLFIVNVNWVSNLIWKLLKNRRGYMAQQYLWASRAFSNNSKLYPEAWDVLGIFKAPSEAQMQ